MTPGAKARARRRPNRADKREANRAKIKGAARKVFGARGFHAATIEEIAEEAGLSNGAIYYNFESKGDLFLALLEERTDERIRRLRGESDTPAGGSRDMALADGARDATRTLKESREWRLLLLEFIAHAARTPALRPKLRAHKRRFRSALEEVLVQRAGKRGATPAMAMDELALAATALANGLAIEEISDPGCVPDDLLGDLIEGLLNAGEAG